jgi:hypothetical protein
LLDSLQKRLWPAEQLQAGQKDRPARPQRAKRRSVLSAVR